MQKVSPGMLSNTSKVLQPLLVSLAVQNRLPAEPGNVSFIRKVAARAMMEAASRIISMVW